MLVPVSQSRILLPSSINGWDVLIIEIKQIGHHAGLITCPPDNSHYSQHCFYSTGGQVGNIKILTHFELKEWKWLNGGLNVMSKWQWWPDFEQVCALNMTGPKKAPEPQDAGKKDQQSSALQLSSVSPSCCFHTDNTSHCPESCVGTWANISNLVL